MNNIRPGVVVALFAFWSFNAISDDLSKNVAASQRFCKESDLAGVYLMVYFKETGPENESVIYRQFPYQYLAFYPKHLYHALSSDTELMSPEKMNQYFAAMSKSESMKYSVREGGVLDLYINDMIRYHYRCIISLVDANDFKKGDLILDGYSKNGKSEFYKLYRRWY